MTSFEKVIKGACKPKAAPPKAKYLDPIIAATWSEDGAVHDVCKALAPRLREPNVIVVFKALLVLHTMIRNGATDNVLKCLSSSDVLRLRNVSAGNWEGYNAPQNLQQYAIYLDTRIRAFRDLKHDAIRVQSETNRDMRNSAGIEEDRMEASSARRRGKSNPPPPSSINRSKTIAGRKLRVMTVEKGLLRETKIVQKMIDALIDCRFYLDDLEDELNITALRMLVKDLLILFQACNEGVINVLEHYFEMSHIDATQALAIYRHFCKETERVMEYLTVAKKLQNLLNVPIPNLRHAPVSLAGALEEYLNDPNFEQNRIEYKTSKESADRNAKMGSKTPAKSSEKASTSPTKPASPAPAAPSTAAPANQAMVDFFTAIEEEQQPMFAQSGSPTNPQFQLHAPHNPFAQQQMQMQMQVTGAPFGQPHMQMQPTGFMMSQPTGFQAHSPHNPFGMHVPQQPPQQQPFLQPQQTAFLQPQMTGANPFRQSMVMPQTTGIPSFGGMGGGTSQPQSPPTNPFPQAQSTSPFVQMQPTAQFPQNSGPFGQLAGQPGASNLPSFNPASSMSASSSSPFSFASPTAQSPSFSTSPTGPARPSTAPLSSGFGSGPSASSSGPPPSELVKTHQTGSRNPFGVPQPAPAPPVPKPPTLLELTMGNTNFGGSQQIGSTPGQQPSQQTGTTAFGSNALSSPQTSSPGQNGSVMSSVASAFTGANANCSKSPGPPLSNQPTLTGSTFSDSLFSSLSSNQTGATTMSSAPSISVSSPATSSSPTLKPQMTGFSGMKQFKPSSSFGAALLESLPSIPQSAPTTPSGEIPTPASPPTSNATSPGSNLSGGLSGGFSGLSSQPTGFGFGSLNSQPTGAGGPGGLNGSSVGVGLRPQATGAAGAANPFRASMFSMGPQMTGAPFGGSNGTQPFLGSSSTSGMGNSLFGLNSQPTGMPPFGTNQFGGPGMGVGAGQGASKTQQGGSASLI